MVDEVLEEEDYKEGDGADDELEDEGDDDEVKDEVSGKCTHYPFTYNS